MKVRNNRAITN